MSGSPPDGSWGLVSVSGLPGSGTTTASTRVAHDLTLEFVPGGEVFRAMAADRGMTLREFGAHAAEHPAVDVELDTRLAARARAGGVVIESRLAGWIVRREGLRGVTVWIDCAPDVRARRVAEREGLDVAAAAIANAERQQVERDRYLALYGIDLTDMSIYDLVLDSAKLSPGEIAEQVVDLVKARTG